MARAAKGPDALEAGEIDDGGLSSLLGFHLRMANIALYRDFAAAMAELELTQRQAAMLFLISANPGTPQVAIARRLGADRATIMALVDRLEARGLITRQRSAADRRLQELNVTALGKKTATLARARIIAHENKFTARLSKAEVELLKDMLSRLNG